MELIKYGYHNLYIYKESGNLYIKEKLTGESKPIQYGLYDSENNPIALRDYMNLRGLDIIGAVEELEKCNTVLQGHTFNIMFYTEEDKDKLVKLLNS